MHSAYYHKEIQSTRWRKLRNWYLQQHPLCARCEELYGIKTMAECVHHVRPVDDARKDEEKALLMYNINNLQSLCYHCHHEIHNAEGYHTMAKVRERGEQMAMAAYENLFGDKNNK